MILIEQSLRLSAEKLCKPAPQAGMDENKLQVALINNIVIFCCFKAVSIL